MIELWMELGWSASLGMSTMCDMVSKLCCQQGFFFMSLTGLLFHLARFFESVKLVRHWLSNGYNYYLLVAYQVDDIYGR
jgi:hypothetical protein